MKKFSAFLSLFTSVGTLICCALPALFVAVGLGAVVAGVVTQVPQLIWLSEHKAGVFSVAAALLILSGTLQWRAATLACPTDAAQGEACQSARDYSRKIYLVSVAIFLIGLFFAYGPLSRS